MRINKTLLTELERLSPGSVLVDEETGEIVLIGWRLEQFVNPSRDQDSPQNIEANTCKCKGAQVPGDFSSRPAKGIKHESLSIWMINPLTQTPKEATKGGKSDRGCGIYRKKTPAINNEYNNSNNNQDLVPVIKNQLRQRVVHFFTHIFLRR
ncbi:hypothetical protein [Martelella alba]|uniref:Uncharacterized protein n=1 Tax=Martelella alba TaxID=2590451 RepID=A0ABY2SEL5_9HYPH|nr:hypothetical protein [Martelella alba]TKI02411.1 hypothetical protein FCN80_25110 [Martelella alba]